MANDICTLIFPAYTPSALETYPGLTLTPKLNPNTNQARKGVYVGERGVHVSSAYFMYGFHSIFLTTQSHHATYR